MEFFISIVVIVVIFLLIAFLGMCRMIGKRFLGNLRHKKPGEKFNENIDISFYMNGPLPKLAEKGVEYMKSIPHEDVYIQSEDGIQLHGTLFLAPNNSSKYVVGIHGFQSKAWHEFAPHIEFYQSIGFGMLLPDDRGHGKSEGEYATMGVKDRRDCINWVNYLVDRFGKNIQVLLHGVSMGGATVLSASGEKDLPKEVIGVISDCGFTSPKESFECQIESMFHIPPQFPVRVGQWYAKHKAHFDLEEAQPIDQVKCAKVPILFVQGSKDIMVPEYMAHKLYEACSSKKKLLIVPQANHGESIAYDPAGYHESIHTHFNI